MRVKLTREGYSKIYENKTISYIGSHENDEEVTQFLADGGTVEPEFTATELQQQAVSHFTQKTDAFIQAKINDYNEAAGTAFNNVHNCESYSRIPTYPHQVFCEKVWFWSVAIWKTVRTYQATATTIPTDDEFNALLEGVEW